MRFLLIQISMALLLCWADKASAQIEGRPLLTSQVGEAATASNPSFWKMAHTIDGQLSSGDPNFTQLKAIAAKREQLVNLAKTTEEKYVAKMLIADALFPLACCLRSGRPVETDAARQQRNDSAREEVAPLLRELIREFPDRRVPFDRLTNLLIRGRETEAEGLVLAAPGVKKFGILALEYTFELIFRSHSLAERRWYFHRLFDAAPDSVFASLLLADISKDNASLMAPCDRTQKKIRNLVAEFPKWAVDADAWPSGFDDAAPIARPRTIIKFTETRAFDDFFPDSASKSRELQKINEQIAAVKKLIRDEVRSEKVNTHNKLAKLIFHRTEDSHALGVEHGNRVSGLQNWSTRFLQGYRTV